MAIFSQPLFAVFSSALSGQIGNVGFRIYDKVGVLRVSRTTSGISERVDASGAANTGVYLTTVSLDTAWLPCREVWDITGKSGVVAEGVIGDSVVPSILSFKTDADWKNLLASGVGNYSFTPPSSYPGEGTLVIKDESDNILLTSHVQFDANKVPISRVKVS